MSKFEVLVEEVSRVEDHPNADRLSLVGVRGYNCVSAKLEDGSHRYKVGDKVVYIPEGAVVPDWLLKKGFWNEKEDKGFLAGSKGNRVKAIKLRDVISQGILFSVELFEGFDPEKNFCLADFVVSLNWTHLHEPDWELIPIPRIGDDVTELLGIVKYEPEVPESMSGDAVPIGIENVFHFDIENAKKFPHTLDGHEVVAEEKLHGTCSIFGYIPEENENLINGHFLVSSKGLFAKGISIKDTEGNREKNTYLKMFNRLILGPKMQTISKMYNKGRAVYVLGEIYGKGVQDLTYSKNETDFAAFGLVFVQEDGSKKWVDIEKRNRILIEDMDLEIPPLVYEGEYNYEYLRTLTGGVSLIDGKTIREGIVITAKVGFEDRWLGRSIVKSVSDDYLLRRGGTEYN